MQNQKAIELHDIPDNQIRNYYASAFQQGRPLQAFIICCEAINRSPSDEIHILSMSTIIRAVQVQNIAPPMKTAIQHCLDVDYVGRQAFAHIWQQIILKDDTYAPLHALLACNDYDHFCRELNLNTIRPCLMDEFLQIGLRTLLVTHIGIEKLLTRLRRYILEHRTNVQNDIPICFLSALAQLCFFNEYVFYCDERENTPLNTLKSDIEAGNHTPFSITLYGCYAPLYLLENAAEIPNSKIEKETIDQQIKNYLEEQKLKETIPEIKTIKNKTSNAVRDMYEENPYPRWDSITVHQDVHSNVTGHHLIAGCGTGKPTTQIALKFPNMRITAIDLSLSSIAFAKRKSAVFGANNIEFHHGDILDLPHLDKEFDSIDCSGVLHHMKNPTEGWRSLLSVLKPGGRMNIGLYSTYARKSVFAARDYIQDKGYSSDASGIRQFRRDVMNIKHSDGNPLKQISQRPDFYSTSQCRDLVFHIQEKTYTLPDLQSMLDELDLEFEGFWLGLPKFEAHYAKTYPNDPQMRNLANWDAIERQYPNIFAAMYQFICRRKSDAGIANQTWDGIKNSGLFKISGS